MLLLSSGLRSVALHPWDRPAGGSAQSAPDSSGAASL